MRKWLYDNPWIWVVLFLACLIGASVATVIIAEVNKPEIVKPKTPRKSRGGTPSSQAAMWRWDKTLDGSAREVAPRTFQTGF
ncbi:MAG: hypothetical protein IPG61_05385 [bacterium]|nr:hypothetical protein [bacterium]